MGVSIKCPDCGAVIPDGLLCCEKCGFDIRIVPDYEPELEDSISESIGNGIAEAPVQKKQEKNNTKDYKDNRFRHDRTSHFVMTTLIVCLFGLIIAVATVIVVFVKYFSYDYQIRKAVECVGQSRYDKAVEYYERALELENADVEVYFALAEVYMNQGNKIEYEYILRNIIKNSLCTQDQLERAYGKLISIYSSAGEYDTIVEILNNSRNQEICNTYQIYFAEPPIFNYDEGSYDKAVPLKLTSNTTGSIYYTLDGTEPDSSSQLYTAPILLDQLDVVVKAVFINEYGIVSEVVTKEYDVVINIAEEPRISAISGEYFTPMMIEVLDNNKKDVYYTTDGSKPDIHSNLYTGPIPMPLGESIFSFAFIEEDGTISEVAKREYKLTFQSDVSVEDAEALVVEYMLILRKILLEDGTFSNSTSAKYLYKYQYLVKLEGYGDYYVIAEIYRDEDGVQHKTGSYYAVNAYEKECYKLIINEQGNYSLVTINLDSQS